MAKLRPEEFAFVIGPRLGASYVFTDSVAYTEAVNEIYPEGEYYPFMTLFGISLEQRVLLGMTSSHFAFQEVIMVGGLEQSIALPSASFLIGYRDLSGFEVGAGPTISFSGLGVIVAAGCRGYTIGVDARNGRQLWSYTGYPDKGWNIPSPIIIDGDRVLITGGYGAGSAMFKVEREGDTYATRELWKNRNMGTKIAQAILYKGMIYGNSADVGGGLRCLDLDGNILWDSKANGRAFEMGNLLVADGLIFIVDGRNGQFFMVEATPEGYRELGQTSFLSGNKVWAPMAYKDGRLLLRDQGKLVCVDLRR